MEGIATGRRLLRDILPPRPCWADLQDSSQENLQDSQPGPPLSQGSYQEDSQEDGVRAGLTESLERKAALRSSSDMLGDGWGSGGSKNPMDTGSQSQTDTKIAPGRLQSVPEASEAPAQAPLAPLSLRLRGWKRSGQREVVADGQLGQTPSPPPTTPARRRRRSEMDGGATTTAGANSTITPPPARRRRRSEMEGIQRPPPLQPVAPTIPDTTEEDWARRLQKRRAAVAAIKRMPEYAACTEGVVSGALDEDEVPLTPEPDDCTVSKRQWEAAVMQWRGVLKTKALSIPVLIDLEACED